MLHCLYFRTNVCGDFALSTDFQLPEEPFIDPRQEKQEWRSATEQARKDSTEALDTLNEHRQEHGY
jgi:hypothetical protein